jgi:hypothetical protein
MTKINFAQQNYLLVGKLIFVITKLTFVHKIQFCHDKSHFCKDKTHFCVSYMYAKTSSFAYKIDFCYLICKFNNKSKICETDLCLYRIHFCQQNSLLLDKIHLVIFIPFVCKPLTDWLQYMHIWGR